MTTPPIPEISQRLLAALVAAYPEQVWSRLPERPPGIEQAVRSGQEWLQATLTELLSLPFAEQRRGPLEVFQEAMRFPTERLRSAGVEPAARDPVSVSALPGDVYDLAPASTRDLGEEVWQIHLAWGAAKAAAITGSLPPGRNDAGR